MLQEREELGRVPENNAKISDDSQYISLGFLFRGRESGKLLCNIALPNEISLDSVVEKQKC